MRPEREAVAPVVGDVKQRRADVPQVGVKARAACRHLRSIFTYPVELTVFTNKSEHITFIGYLRDISTSGACVEFEDKYGRYNMNEIKNTKTKISFSILEGEKVDIFAQAKWVKKATDRTVSMNIGIEFKYMESWDVIDKLIGMKNKDRNMMWNLWEHFFK